ncbi:retinol dehydrogenase 12-like isoform X2 [Hyalella azteca]|uniref:Retinol dehydrogenase 12-like isoform X2 n=1 Tax=Hyalella azteca TaxID=294128 RepID=A0A979FPD4_HYAAZ|nr:retinol dehydrogenase 12-like isoform X2 [Hyalella azteca]
MFRSSLQTLKTTKSSLPWQSLWIKTSANNKQAHKSELTLHDASSHLPHGALLWQYLVGGVSVTGLLWSALWVVAVRRYLAGGLCTSTARLTGQTVVITGANVGIGKETARDLLRRGAHVILACRSFSKAEEARRSLLGEGGKVEVRLLDLSSLQSVRDFAAGLVKDNIKVHILINNAGVFMCPYMETQEGFEMQMGTNHLGHFLLTNLLLPQMKQHGEPARIINVSSTACLGGKIDLDDLFQKKKPYDALQSYSNSKLANVLFTRRLAHLLRGTKIQVFALHPGSVVSSATRHVMSSTFFKDYVISLALKTTLEGAQTTVYCATEAQQHSEMYFSDCAVGWALDASKDERLAEDFWKLSAQLVKLDE